MVARKNQPTWPGPSFSYDRLDTANILHFSRTNPAARGCGQEVAENTVAGTLEKALGPSAEQLSPSPSYEANNPNPTRIGSGNTLRHS